MGKKALNAVLTADAETRLSAADRARRAFDVRLVASVLVYVSRAGETLDESNLPAVALEVLAWIPKEIEGDAKRARIPLAEAVLSAQTVTVKDCAESEFIFQQFFGLWFGMSLSAENGSFTTPKLIPHRPNTPLRFARGRNWLDQQLARLYVVEHYRITESGVLRVSVPYLNCVSRCVAYAIALIMENRWGIADRVRVCPFRPDPEDGFHLFIDYRLQSDGTIETGRSQEFCSARHASAHRQRRFRSQIAKRTAK